MSTHDSLIELTDTLIQQNGYQGFSYADLADGLGIRKASIHYHFQTKTDLGLAYCEYKEASLLKLEAALLQLPPGKARLQGYMDAFLNAPTAARCVAFTPCCPTAPCLKNLFRKPPHDWHKPTCAS
jgi:AcrR family transcriptional regulator